MEINKITVIGSGVMGSGIAAHLVNGGFTEVHLLDILPPKLDAEQEKKGYSLSNPHMRNIVSRKNLNSLLAGSPPQLGAARLAKNIILGNTTDNFDECVSSSDWIIEVVPEIASIKNETFKRIDRVRRADSIVTSNTSGISIGEMIEGCSAGLQEHFLITHFFNPARYMKLLEIVAGASTKKDVLRTIAEIGEERLGKGIVFSFDVPAFVGNRIGVFNIMYLMSLTGEFSIDTINAVFDKKLGYGGKPFSTCDLVGLDTLGHVVEHIYANATNDECRDVFKLPPFVAKLIENKNLGRKTGAGFYKREKAKGKMTDYVIDPVSGEYVIKREPRIKSLMQAKKAKEMADAMRILYDATDVGGIIYRKTIDAVIRYSFARAPEISPDGIEGVDKSIRWGFNQKFGPGEVLNILGVNKVVKNIEKEGEIPGLLKELYKTGKGFVYYENENKEEYVFEEKDKFRRVKRPESFSSFREIAAKTKPVFEIKNGGRLFDAGDGVFAVEMLSRNGTINMEVIDAISKALEIAEKDGRGLVIGNDLDDFSYGADLDMLLGFALRGKSDAVEHVIKSFQMMNYRLKFSKVPVVTMKRGMCLGGGCELGYGTHIRAAHDSYIGLVEIGVGLIPAGGGIKETLIRKYKKHAQKEHCKPIDFIRETFEQILMTKVAMSAHEARSLDYMSEEDAISMNSDFLLHDAKADVIRLSDHYVPPTETFVPLPGRDIKAALYTGIDLAIAARQLPPMKVPNFIRRHFELVTKVFADVVSGGDILPPGKKFGELELLDMERKAFLRLTSELSLKEKFSWLQIASFRLKKKPFSWAVRSVKNSLFNIRKVIL